MTRFRTTTAADTRRRILDEASQLLVDAGPEALSMRKISQRVGASTIVLYTHFRDKQAILDDLFAEGFERLHADLEAVVPDADPMQYLVDLGRAYRRSAIGNPTYYQLMFSRCVPGFDPSARSRDVSKRPFSILHAAVERCIDQGAIPGGDSVQIANALWGTLHGLISLELFGYLPSSEGGEARLEHAVRILREGLRHYAAVEMPA